MAFRPSNFPIGNDASLLNPTGPGGSNVLVGTGVKGDPGCEFFNAFSDFPVSGDTGIIYIANDTNKIYRWTGTIYQPVGGVDAVVWGDITQKPTFSTVATTGNYNDLSNRPNLALKADLFHTHFWADITDKPTFSTVATTGSYDDLSNKPDLSLKADLVGNKVPASQLPSYVDAVVEYATRNDFPASGSGGKIYVALDSEKTYRWSGTTYVEVSPSEVISVNGQTGSVTIDSVFSVSRTYEDNDLNLQTVSAYFMLDPASPGDPPLFVLTNTLGPHPTLVAGGISADQTISTTADINCVAAYATTFFGGFLGDPSGLVGTAPYLDATGTTSLAGQVGSHDSFGYSDTYPSLGWGSGSRLYSDSQISSPEYFFPSYCTRISELTGGGVIIRYDDGTDAYNLPLTAGGLSSTGDISAAGTIYLGTKARLVPTSTGFDIQTLVGSAWTTQASF